MKEMYKTQLKILELIDDVHIMIAFTNYVIDFYNIITSFTNKNIILEISFVQIKMITVRENLEIKIIPVKENLKTYILTIPKGPDFSINEIHSDIRNLLNSKETVRERTI